MNDITQRPTLHIVTVGTHSARLLPSPIEAPSPHWTYWLNPHHWRDIEGATRFRLLCMALILTVEIGGMTLVSGLTTNLDQQAYQQASSPCAHVVVISDGQGGIAEERYVYTCPSPKAHTPAGVSRDNGSERRVEEPK